MATKQGTLTIVDNFQARASWPSITEADTGTAVGMQDYPDRTVQIAGTFGAGTVILEGSMDGTNFAALHDYQGAAISISDTSLHLIAENTPYIRPRATAGSGMNVAVTIIGVR